MYKNYVIDATISEPSNGLFCFCPIEGDIHGDFSIIIGLNFLSDRPPKGSKLVAIVHADGQKAVEEFCNKYKKELNNLEKILKSNDRRTTKS